MSSCLEAEHSPIFVNGPIVVGAGPSGLSVAACLSNRGVPSVILERTDCLASLWQKRTYDRLKLHLPKHYCELPLMEFPKNFPRYPSKQQFITYIECYAARFNIKPVFNQTVEKAKFDVVSGLWKVKTQDCVYTSKWLVVATGENAEPVVPDIPGLKNFYGPVVHTSAYKSGSEFANRKVLVVGCGNSGMEVCLDLCRYNALPHMVVRNSLHVLPRDVFGLSSFGIAMTLLKWFPLKLVDNFLLLLANSSLGNTDRLGIRRPKTGPIELKNATGKTPVLDVGAISLIQSGQIRVTVKAITKKGAKFVDGQEMEFDSIILATGYKSNVPDWLEENGFFTKEGMPKTPFPNGWKGENGLYTVGFTRRGLLGTVFDAVKIAEDITDQWMKSEGPLSASNICSSWGTPSPCIVHFHFNKS
ncbi:unnamed protein product [Eruca vesicaria subsp. sativa]|uniref:indole-3-pyruvate monooxygenase n=1 Tax=Eruca vesicaria subsp. sativa TaxID=29727 RepID=A0ABC8JE69_ERUVS|nr:unnamed protein product [Eruca vesicaria subsp. sativa]